MHNRRSCRHKLLCLLVLTAFFSSGAAAGAEQHCELEPHQEPGWLALVVLRDSGCLGGGADTTAITKAVLEAIDVEAGAWRERRPAVARALDLLKAYATVRAASPGEFSSSFKELVVDLSAALNALGTGGRISLPQSWSPDLNQEKPIWVLDLAVKSEVDEVCTPVACPTSSCQERFNAALELVRIAALATRSLLVSKKETVSDLLEDLTTQERK